VIAAVVAVLGISTFFSFRYWQTEALAASEHQALLAASATRAALESSLRAGRHEVARRNLHRLIDGGAVRAARVYAPDHTLVLSTLPSEEGRAAHAIWIPRATELPRDGLARMTEDEDGVLAYLPIASEDFAVLEVEFAVSEVRAAMQRGALLGLGLLAVSVLIVVLLVVTMLEREVVAPIHRMEGLLPDEEDKALSGQDEIGRIQRSVARLIEKEREVEEAAAESDRRLAAQEGLARVGELATEMAHEFKRPLASIRTAVDVLEQEYVLADQGRKMLDAVNLQLERLSETMEDLFSLARPVVLEEAYLDLADVLDDALVELAGLVDTGKLGVLRQYPRGIGLAGDARRLRQALLNLLTNAVEAMPEGGTLELSISEVGGHWEVRVTDSGAGLDPEEVERVFLPFYSTKPFGTGLGLPLVARVVAAHGGEFSLSPAPGGGTVAKIVLPRGASGLKPALEAS
jgi:signal transduction histidine kinase